MALDPPAASGVAQPALRRRRRCRRGGKSRSLTLRCLEALARPLPSSVISTFEGFPAALTTRMLQGSDLHGLASLRSLWLSDPALCDSGPDGGLNAALDRAFSLVSEACLPLVELDVSSIALRTAGAALLVRSLPSPGSGLQGALPHLATLCAAGCKLSDVGVTEIARALLSYPTLEELDLSENGVGRGGAQQLAILLSAASREGEGEEGEGESDEVDQTPVETPVGSRAPSSLLSDEAEGKDEEVLVEATGRAEDERMKVDEGDEIELIQRAVHPAAPPQPRPLRGAELDDAPDSVDRFRCARLRVLELSLNPLGEAGVVALCKGLRRNRHLCRLGMRYVNCDPYAGDLDTLPRQGWLMTAGTSSSRYSSTARLESFSATPLLESPGLRTLDLGFNFISSHHASSARLLPTQPRVTAAWPLRCRSVTAA
jgi:hypothetical protein